MIEPTDATQTVLYEQYQVPVSDWLPEQDAFVTALYQPELGPTGLYLIRTNGTVESLVTDDPYITDEYPFPLHSVADGLYVMWESDYTSCQVNLLALQLAL